MMDCPVLVYDGECPICQRAVAWVRERAKGAMICVPCQRVEFLEAAPGLAMEDCRQAVWLVEPGGRLRSGADALAGVFALLPRWRWLGRLMLLPGMRTVSGWCYRRFAPRRMAFAAFLGLKCEPASCAVTVDYKKDNS